ncbi:MAG: hypothetical protein ABI963_10785 [Rhizomicrobium sp.]
MAAFTGLFLALAAAGRLALAGLRAAFFGAAFFDLAFLLFLAPRDAAAAARFAGFFVFDVLAFDFLAFDFAALAFFALAMDRSVEMDGKLRRVAVNGREA